MENNSKLISWDEVKLTAEEAFDIWVGQPEINWAKKAWEIIGEAGLTSYSNECEYQERMIYFLALAGVYRDFCCAAFDECVGYNYAEWAESLGIKIAALSKDKIIEFIDSIEEHLTELDEEGIFGIENFKEKEKEFIEDHLEGIANDARKVIVPELLRGFGDDSGLFVSFWKSTKKENEACQSTSKIDDEDDYYEDNEDEDDYYEDDYYETDEDILNTLTPNKEQAFMWITEGCYPYQ